MRKTLYLQTRERLMDLILAGKLANGNQLLSEEELATSLEVSRTTIREVLASLAREGVISKKQGLGNFIHPSALRATMRIDKTCDFINLLEEAGYKAVHVVNEQTFQTVPASGDICRKMGLPEGEELFVFESDYLAGELPAIHCHFYIPNSLFLERPTTSVERNIFSFLKKYCNQEATHAIVWFNATTCNHDLAHIFAIAPHTPLLYWEEIYYNLADDIICYSEVKFNPHVMCLSMLRKAELV
ncbi:GntR family transcriptional regulator [Moorella naiadis]|uniref:GntR family transcriptional regulator n=1 Tax=Moorella naiadis (nom. illeg.) TaxID=3093670 RepID=UPI003D9C90E5